jgi:serine/threonine protein phosphatase PrpC
MLTASWRIAVATDIGTSHKATGSPCQDSAANALVRTGAGETLILAVSDGAGSAAHSQIGSSVAVATLLADVESFLADGNEISSINNEQASQWVRNAAEAIEKIANANEHEVREYSCTLLAAIVGPTQAAFIQIGDGAIVVSHGEDDGWSYVFWPQHGEFVNTTNFIQSTPVEDVIAFQLAPRTIDELALFTDGIENLVLHKASRSVHQSFFQSMIQPVRGSDATGEDGELSQALSRYLASSIICERTDDDKTLILASRISLGQNRDELSPA